MEKFVVTWSRGSVGEAVLEVSPFYLDSKRRGSTFKEVVTNDVQHLSVSRGLPNFLRRLPSVLVFPHVISRTLRKITVCLDGVDRITSKRVLRAIRLCTFLEKAEIAGTFENEHGVLATLINTNFDLVFFLHANTGLREALILSSFQNSILCQVFGG